MALGALHTTWLSLIDRSGPFLSVQVLEAALPQGLDVVQSKFRQKLRLAYEEWREAVDLNDSSLEDLTQEWIKLVLHETLEYDERSLRTNSDKAIKYQNSDANSEYVPTFIVGLPESDVPRFCIHVLAPGTNFEEAPEGDDWSASYIERMTLLCRAIGMRYGLLTDGEKWTVVSAPSGATSGTATWYARLWRYEPVTLKAFQTLISARRCFGPSDSTLDYLLDQSLGSYEEITNTLGEQVRRAVEVLIQSLDSADQDRNRELLKDIPPAELYDAAVTVMMRLVFVLCAEERGLLLLGDSNYDQFYAVSTLRGQLVEEAAKLGPEVLERRHDAWSRLLATFRVIFAGIEHESLRLPPLGGSLFDPDKYPFLEGRKNSSQWASDPATPLPIDNRTVLLLLSALQILEQRGGALQLSYRALDVEQIGHVYEGLLDNTVSRVPEVTLGVESTKRPKTALVPLSKLEILASEGTSALVDFLVNELGRSSSAIERHLSQVVTDEDYGKVLLACGGNDKLALRIKPFYRLLKNDIWGQPLVYQKGAYAVTLGVDRKESGTHYTPKALTETIVSVVLNPLIYTGPAEGSERHEWKLKSSAALLDLKICDPAMGSAAFLVQACRYLSEHLVLAWQKEDSNSTASFSERPKLLHDQLLSARRMVSERCLYGVDRNPLAVELAKLSLWLITLAKGKPFEFLDHNLKCGDSLLGVSNIEQLRSLSMLEVGSALEQNLWQSFIDDHIQKCLATRQQLRNIRIIDFKDAQAAADIHRTAQGHVQKLKIVADVVSGLDLENTCHDGTLSANEVSLTVAEFFAGSAAAEIKLNQLADVCLSVPSAARTIKLVPFHWVIEFPEVFLDGSGFDAILGNPPFLGNKYWRSMLGSHTQSLAKQLLKGTPGKIDLCILFHRRAVNLLRPGGAYGLLGTNNIAEGSAIAVGLGTISNQGTIFWAKKAFPWPGSAAVSVAIVCFIKGSYLGLKFANDQSCHFIDAKLEAENVEGRANRPVYKITNGIYSGEGVHNGKGLAFLLAPDSPWFDRLQNESNSLLRPYISGEDITKNGLTEIVRYALDIQDRTLSEIENGWPIAYRFLIEVVRPHRTEAALRSYPGQFDRWWQFCRTRGDFYQRIRRHPSAIVYPKAPKYPICMLAPSSWIYTNKVLLLAVERDDMLAICLSSFFSLWLEDRSGGRLGKTGSLTLSIDQALETFPMPAQSLRNEAIELANEFNNKMIEWCRQNDSGITDLMNAFHSRESDDLVIRELRETHQTIDSIAAQSFGFDLDMAHGFHNYSSSALEGIERYGVSDDVRKAIFDRLIELNNSAPRRAPGRST